MFVSGLLYTLTAAVASNSAATRAGGVVWSGTWASQSTTVSFDWCVLIQSCQAQIDRATYGSQVAGLRLAQNMIDCMKCHPTRGADNVPPAGLCR